MKIPPTFTQLWLGCLSFMPLVCRNGLAQDTPQVAVEKALVFHASFDDSADAKVRNGDGRVYTTESLARKQWTPG
ncbi:MAG: hypothetical protein ACKO3V_06545, partial [Pirellula sp.]